MSAQAEKPSRLLTQLFEFLASEELPEVTQSRGVGPELRRGGYAHQPTRQPSPVGTDGTGTQTGQPVSGLRTGPIRSHQRAMAAARLSTRRRCGSDPGRYSAALRR